MVFKDFVFTFVNTHKQKSYDLVVCNNGGDIFVGIMVSKELAETLTGPFTKEVHKKDAEYVVLFPREKNVLPGSRYSVINYAAARIILDM